MIDSDFEAQLDKFLKDKELSEEGLKYPVEFEYVSKYSSINLNVGEPEKAIKKIVKVVDNKKKYKNKTGLF
jgi:predicted DNA binding CopG/RHH family protein